MQYDYDAVIVGGGPAGATAALYAERLGLKVLVVDKKRFPRDKICGDAISGKSIVYLKELGLIDQLLSSPQALVDSVLFSSPNESSVKVSFAPPLDDGVARGYVCRREVFDDILFQEAKKKVDTHEGFTVTALLENDGQVFGVRGRLEDRSEKEYTAKVVIGADGFSSMVARKVGVYDHDPRHHMVATRAYYTGVTGLSTSIELHFVKDVLPGYFWIFPLDNGLANVGLGMIHHHLKKKGVRLRYAHIAATESPFFKERFKNAELVGDIQGWNLPAGSKRRKVHGNGWILLGDAAGLIDAFTGEGIGNAMCSGKVAAEVLAKIAAGSDYSSAATDLYRRKLWKTLWSELNMMYQLQRVGRIYPLVNLVVSRASKSHEVRNWLTGMVTGTISKRELLSPMTYVRLMVASWTPMPTAVITGATGFIGQHLTRSLSGDGWRVIALSRNPRRAAEVLPDAVECLEWDGSSEGDWARSINGADALINLAGENVAGGRWTSAYKQRILDSRVQGGMAIRDAIAQAETPPPVLIQASASGYYGSQGDAVLDEQSNSGDGFLAEVVRQWEAAVAPVTEQGVRLVYLRTGVVLGKNDGMISKLTLPFILFAGGHPGDGQQWLSWIHIADEVAAIRFLLDTDEQSGAFNLVAPEAVRMADFCRQFAERLGRPSWFHQPEFLLRAVFGEMADETLLASQRLAPARLLEGGFRFQFPALTDALGDLLA